MMPLILAEAAPEAAAIGEWLKVFFWLTGSIAAIVIAIKKLKQKEPESPLRVQENHAFVTVPVHEKAIGEIKTELLRHAGRRAEIYRQNEEHGRQIAALQSETTSQTRTIHQLSEQIERLPEKIKNLLLK